MLRTSCVILSLFFFLGCGGEVHFVNDQPIIKTFVTKEIQTVQESFFYGQSSGTQVVVFLMEPRNSQGMSDTLNKLRAHITSFSHSFWSLSQHTSSVHFLVQRDVRPFTPKKFSPSQVFLSRSQWEPEGLNFLMKTFAELKGGTQKGEQDTFSPFETLQDLTEGISKMTANDPKPVWVNFVYFRDYDFNIRNIQGNIEREQKLENALVSFQKSLDLKPLSSYRSFIHLISYLADKTPRHDRETTPTLQKLFQGFNLNKMELDNFLSDADQQSADFVELLAQEIHNQNQKIILERRPSLMTLELQIGRTVVPREDYWVDEKTNEVRFRASINPLPQPGDEIQVRYEPKKH